MSANDKRIAEARECEAKAKEHLKTSIWKMKTKPDYDSAAAEYERAAVCYKNAEKLAESVAAYLEASKCFGLNNNRFHEAKSKESAALVSKDLKDLKRAGQLFREAADGYLHAGVMDTAAMTIDKAAKLMETNDEEEAIALYDFGLTLVQQADRSKMAIAFGQRLIRLQLKRENYPAAKEASIALIEKLKEIGEVAKVGQIVIGLVLISLIKDDPIDALKQLYHLPDTDASEEERSVGNALAAAYEKGDEERLQQVLQRGYLRAMDNEYLRLMRKVHVPECKRQSSKLDAGTIDGGVDGDIAEGELC